jgi:hypothetical protein
LCGKLSPSLSVGRMHRETGGATADVALDAA